VAWPVIPVVLRAARGTGRAAVYRTCHAGSTACGSVKIRSTFRWLAGVEVISTGRNVELAAMLANLTARGIGRLFAEGGTMIHTHLTSRRSDLIQYLKSR